MKLEIEYDPTDDKSLVKTRNELAACVAMFDLALTNQKPKPPEKEETWTTTN